MFKYLILLIFLLLGRFSSFAQQYYFESFSVEQGLSQASISSILEDKLGNLWFATESGGLNKYDGTEFTHFYASNGLPDESIKCLFEDSKGRIWVGTENGGACFIENNKITVIDINKGLSDNNINAIAESSKGEIWIGTENNGLTIYSEKGTLQLGKMNGLLSDEITALLKDDKGNMYVGTRKGLNVFSKASHEKAIEILHFHDYFINCITKDHKNAVWIGSNKGLFCIDEGEILDKNIFSNKLHSISSIYIDYHSDFWLGTANGLFKTSFDSTKQTTLFNEQNGLSNNNIKCIAQDQSGAIWIGTKFGGVNKFIGEKFTSLDMRDGLAAQIITALCVLPDSSIAYGSFSNGVTIKNGKQKLYLNQIELSNFPINALSIDKQNKLWIGTDGNGLFYYENGKLNSYNEHMSANEINCLFTDSKGNVWIGTKHRGIKAIYYQKNNLVFSEVSSLNKFENATVFSFCEDHTGNIWVTTDKGIIQIRNKEKLEQDQLVFTFHNHLDFVGNAFVISSFADYSKEKIWFGTQGKGIFFFHKNKFYPFPNNMALSDLMINSICGNHDELWLGTDKNIKMISLSNFNIQTFSFNEGFEGVQCNRGAVVKDNKGNIWLGTIHGAYKINISETSLIPTDFSPALQLTSVQYNFSDFNWRPYCDSLIGFYKIPNRLELPYHINHLTFHFKGIGHIHPDAIEYKFQLVGHDEQFSPPSKKNEITYTNLKPGEYVFLVYSRLKGGKWNEQAVSIKIVIHAPFWETWWFRFLSLLMIVGLVIMFYKWRTQQLKREKNKLEEIVKERTMDLALEKQKSEQLLQNILPEEIAEELKISGVAKTKLYPHASVMFTDFKGFTTLSGQLTPEVLVQELNNIFVQFDSITDLYRLEKIKTIGDAYMCAGGIPVENKTHAIDCVLAGLEFIRFINSFETNIGHAWEIRVGIHSGPLIAGVVGKKKFAYDIWGDSVNIASRMEANSEPGKLNISQSTYELVKEYFVCEARGELHVKNKGDMAMFFVLRLKAEFSADKEGYKANEKLVRIISDTSTSSNH